MKGFEGPSLPAGRQAGVQGSIVKKIFTILSQLQKYFFVVLQALHERKKSMIST
jgi:hypothetical protein